jgi:hypothetical protein
MGDWGGTIGVDWVMHASSNKEESKTLLSGTEDSTSKSKSDTTVGLLGFAS